MEPKEQEATHKDTILKFLKNNTGKYYDVNDIIRKVLPEIDYDKVRYYLEELELEGFVRESNTCYMYNYRADSFLHDGGYEHKYETELAEDKALLKASIHQIKMQKREDFITNVKFVKSWVWLIGFPVSLLFNLFFILKYVF